MKARLFALALIAVAGCRTSRLGDQETVRRAFAAQASQRNTAPAELDAADARAIMARHREPMTPAQNGAPTTGQTSILAAPSLGPVQP